MDRLRLAEVLECVGALAHLASGLSFGDRHAIDRELGRLGQEIHRFMIVLRAWEELHPEFLKVPEVEEFLQAFEAIQVNNRLADLEARAYGDDLVELQPEITALSAEVCYWAQGYVRGSKVDQALRERQGV